jgi:RNA ligase (TIGR02306 family)
MTDFHVNVVRVGALTPHPDADTLDLTKVFDYPVITKRGAFREGDLAVYVPVDAVVPDTEAWAFLHGRPVGSAPTSRRLVQAKRLRGIFSQGLLVPAPWGFHEGDDVAEFLGITKADDAEERGGLSTGGECEAAPQGWRFPTYTDLESLRRWPRVLEADDRVVITEKIHGANARFCHDGERLWVGSRTQIKRYDPANLWWMAAEVEGLAEKLARLPGLVFFGEVFGQVQDLKYGITKGCAFRCFDVFDVRNGRYLDHEDAREAAGDVGVAWVPELHRGRWGDVDPATFAEGDSFLATMNGAKHVREGFVVKPLRERWHERLGRVILKRHGEGYLLRKKKGGESC